MADQKYNILLTANDETRAAFDSVKSGVDSITSSFTSLQALAASLASGALVAYVKSAINAGDEMFILSQKTGIAVENLAGLELAAKMNGASLESVATGVKKLSTYMFDAAAGSQEHITVLKILGVTAKEPLPAMGQIADQFAKMKDGSEKSALAVRLFGKSGTDLIPMLNAGAAAFIAWIEEGKKLNPVSAEFAKQSNDFNDNLDRLQTAAKGSAMAFVNTLLPSLISTSEKMVELTKEGNKAQAMLMGIAGLGKLPWDLIIPGETPKQAMETANRIRDLSGELTVLKRALETGEGGGFINKWLYGSQDEIKKNIAITEAMIATLQKHKAELDKPPEAPAKPVQDDSIAKKIKAAEDAAKAAADAQAALDKLLEASKRMDAEMVVSHDDAFTKTIIKWIEMENQLVKAGAAGAAARKAHEAAYTVFVEEETKKRLADAAAAEAVEATKRAAALAKGKDYYAKIHAMAEDAGAYGLAREKLWYDRESLALDVEHRKTAAAVAADHEKALAEEAAYQQAKLDLNIAYQARISEGAKTFGISLVQEEHQTAIQRAQTMAAGLANMTAIGAQHNRALFEINKIASIANATISGLQAVQDAYKFGTSWGGPWVGAAMAAIAAASTAANVAAIQSTSFGAGGANTGGAGVPSMATSPGIPVANYSAVPAAPAAAPIAAPVAAPAPAQVNITIVGNNNSMFTYDQVVNQLIPTINQAAGNGVNIKVTVV